MRALAERVPPTRGNLITYKSRLKFGTEAYELLEQKREVLVMELMRVVYGLRDLGRELEEALGEVYSAYEGAVLSMGREAMSRLLGVGEARYEIEVTGRSAMGVVLPSVRAVRAPGFPDLSLWYTTSALDRTIMALRRAEDVLLRYIEVYISVWRLAREISKTQRRLNALEHIFLPKYEATVAFVQEALEEAEREEFFRRKQVKRRRG
ncbi:MAG TPA: V-type ATP synthase subunit D [Candidatus Latescibacteria bacterium]|nr:V-type ATP synthase subunit D [Candidatus Latescibacterota bacterium]